MSVDLINMGSESFKLDSKFLGILDLRTSMSSGRVDPFSSSQSQKQKVERGLPESTGHFNLLPRRKNIAGIRVARLRPLSPRSSFFQD